MVWIQNPGPAVGTGEFYGNPAYWQSSDFRFSRRSTGYGFYSDAYGVGSYYGSSAPTTQWVDDGHSGSGYYTEADSDLVYAGVPIQTLNLLGQALSDLGIMKR